MTRRRLPTHPVARGFDRAAGAYERGRPDYPRPALRHLARTLRLGPGRTVVELASGTGKLTRGLRPYGATIVAVEPSAPMRAVFERVVPDVLVVAGTAEAIPLPDGFADAVVVAQAFHWFRPRRAAREIARVLRPGGTVALLWNVADARFPLRRRLDAIVARFGGPVPRRWSTWRRAFAGARGPFGPLRRTTFRYLRWASAEATVQHILSVSRIAVLGRNARAEVARRVRHLLGTDPLSRGRARVPFPTITEVYWCRRRGGAGRRAPATRRTRSSRRIRRTSGG